MHRFSIVIPVYNVEPYLRECLDSVLAQTFTDWEAICVDDGSTDGSGAILDKHAAKDARFRVIHQKNAGVSAARNVALGVAKGEWVVFLDGDDVLAPAALERILEVVRGRTVSIVRYGHERFEEKASPSFQCIKCEPISFDVSRRICGEILRWKNLNCGALVFLRERAENIRFRNFICGEDRIFGIELLLRSDRVAIWDAKLYGYRNRSGSYVNSKMTLRKLKDEIAYRLEFLKLARNANKHVQIHDCDWLESYFTHSLLVDVKRVVKCDLESAWRMWFDCIADAGNFVGCSACTRFVLAVCRVSGSKIVSLALCRYLPAVVQRARRVFAQGVFLDNGGRI